MSEDRSTEERESAEGAGYGLAWIDDDMEPAVAVCERPQTWLEELGERAERDDEVGVVMVRSVEEDDPREGWI